MTLDNWGQIARTAYKEVIIILLTKIKDYLKKKNRNLLQHYFLLDLSLSQVSF